ncbi:MAG TPA: type II toxin-antitoxin system HicB family antitoxin [Blastocatellia bacterium]|nr:type II toxin-antitoxin system HicB family antitoxin [Blastocatellia bacterium]
MVKEYVVIYERGKESEENWSAYVPDLPGCISTGETLEELRHHIREAIQLHLEGLKAEGLAIPEPTTKADSVSVAA